MKISEAIETITQELEFYDSDISPDPPAAFMLGIEALKRHKEVEERTGMTKYLALPGETPEGDTT